MLIARVVLVVDSSEVSGPFDCDVASSGKRGGKASVECVDITKIKLLKLLPLC
jgi:hypothetical protein